MSVFDVLLQTENIVVLGPPTEIDLKIDVGPKGERGSRFFVGSGDPNLPGVVPSGQNAAIGDIFINASTAVNYGWLYIYVRTPTGNSWTPALRLQPAIFSNSISAIFVDGSCKVSIPLSNIVPDITVLDVEKYIIQVTANRANPVAISISSKDIQGSTLIYALKGAEFLEGTWTDLSGTVSLETSVTVL
jgi:hypothetical protein